jgi:hypothetical protein
MTRESKDRSDMKLTRTNLLAVATALGALAIAAPVSTAGAAAPAAIADPPAAQAATVTGPTIFTTAPATFINFNSQVSAAGNSSAGQYA